jgi:hypothetical protein
MKVEEIARAVHDGWWQFMLMNGWRLGPRNSKAKTHPHLVHWELLDRESQEQDKCIATLLICIPREIHPGDVHEAWRAVANREHPHNKPYVLAHPLHSAEHWLQSVLINAILCHSKAQDFVDKLHKICAEIYAMASVIRHNPEMLGIRDMLHLTVVANEAQNACIEMARAISVAHTLWLVEVYPDLNQPTATEWIEHQRAVQKYSQKQEAKLDLPAVLSDIDTTP